MLCGHKAVVIVRNMMSVVGLNPKMSSIAVRDMLLVGHLDL